MRFFLQFACLLLTFSVFISAAGSAFAGNVQLRDAVLRAEQGRTSFTLTLDKPVAFSAVAETNPNRVIIDIDAEASEPGQIHAQAAGMVSAYHFEQVNDGHLRIVLETKSPAVISWSTIQTANKTTRPKLKVDLAEVAAEPEANPQTGSVSPVATDAEPTKPKFIIVIDPGHGGMDPGASSVDHVREKDVVLAFGLALKKKLEMTGHYVVVMTRDDDTFISLQDRTKIAREIKADLFIAIHADKLDDPSVRGTTIYTVSDKASDAEAEALAQNENRADIISGMDLGKQNAEVANMLINLAQRESKSQAVMFAKQAVNEIRPVTELTSKPMRSAAFVVLKAPDVPSVLVELGYLSNSADRGMLLSTKWREDMAAAMTRAVEQHFAPVATAAKQ